MVGKILIFSICLRIAMWIIGNFSDTQILRETNFRDSRKPKAAIFAISEILNVDFWEISALKKCKTSK